MAGLFIGVIAAMTLLAGISSLQFESDAAWWADLGWIGLSALAGFAAVSMYRSGRPERNPAPAPDYANEVVEPRREPGTRNQNRTPNQTRKP
jgi:hypothetical protein